jgi:hypothetical protein
MASKVTIGLVGDHDASVPAHRAIPLALLSAAEWLHLELAFAWVPTEEVLAASRISAFDGLWCVPASPYRNMEGALLAIRHARENRLPFLGTCGGFQHALIEYARNVLGWSDAEHAETDPAAARAVVTLLECPLVEAVAPVRFSHGSRIAAAYGTDGATVGYRCRDGLNAQFRAQLLGGPLRATAEDEGGDVREPDEALVGTTRVGAEGLGHARRPRRIRARRQQGTEARVHPGRRPGEEGGYARGGGPSSFSRNAAAAGKALGLEVHVLVAGEAAGQNPLSTDYLAVMGARVGPAEGGFAFSALRLIRQARND